MIITLDYDDVTLYAHNIYVMFYLHNNAHVGWRLAAALLPLLFRKNPRSHHKGATWRVELDTNCFQFYAIANLDKTSL